MLLTAADLRRTLVEHARIPCPAGVLRDAGSRNRLRCSSASASGPATKHRQTTATGGRGVVVVR